MWPVSDLVGFFTGCDCFCPDVSSQLQMHICGVSILICAAALPLRLIVPLTHPLCRLLDVSWTCFNTTPATGKRTRGIPCGINYFLLLVQLHIQTPTLDVSYTCWCENGATCSSLYWFHLCSLLQFSLPRSNCLFPQCHRLPPRCNPTPPH